MRREQDDRDEYLDKLIIRFGKAVEGETCLDVACVCASMVAFSLGQRYKDQPEEGKKALAGILKFITVRFEDYHKLNEIIDGITSLH